MQPIATYLHDGGGAAVIEYQPVEEDVVAQGLVRLVGFELGAAYGEREDYCYFDSGLPMVLGRYPTDYDVDLRNAVLDAVSSLPWDYSAEEPLLELVPITFPGGEALVLVNYSDTDLVQTPVHTPYDAHALFADVDLPAGPDGLHLVDVARNDVEVLISLTPPVPSPLPPEPPASSAETCGCQTTPSSAWLALISLLGLLRRRSR
jgi:MYXO-CTERM domain-containing protein